jgi:hypothetical protein
VPDLLTDLELLVGVLVGLAVGCLLIIFLRRRAIGRGKIVSVCAVRRRPGSTWRQGILRFGEDQIEWYALDGLSLRPRHRWSRRVLQLGSPIPLGSGDGLDAVPGTIAVDCQEGPNSFRLALPGPAYTALRTWLEAVPPGSAGSVT